VADQSLRVPDLRVQARLNAAIDREAKIPLALGQLAPIEDHRVLLIDPDAGLRERQLAQLGGRVTSVRNSVLGSVPPASADVVVACWSAIRPGEEPAAHQVGEVMRILVTTGRLLVVHDYGRDDVSALLGGPSREEQLMAWSHREGPFLANGFKLKVLHCWWSWDTLEEASEVLTAAFGEAGERVGAGLRRPRLAYKVAVYHRDHERAAVAPGAAA
jgi:hypothetical protein